MKSPRKMKKELLRRKKELIDLYSELENKFKKKIIDQTEFENEKHKIDRELVEIMDRLTQMRFFL